MGLPNCLNQYQDEIKHSLVSLIPTSDSEHIQMIKYHLGWLDSNFEPIEADPGKLSRPSIALLVCETLGGSIKDALPAASAIQIFHDFTLMHDDIEDGDELRRHRETVWKVWGVPRAINAGDAMYTISMQTLLKSPKKKEELLDFLLYIYSEIVRGQELDLSFVSLSANQVTIERYLEMISKKSALLIGASAKAGAILAEADIEIQEKFFDFGYNLGISYQIYDDFVSIWGSAKASGKKEHMDITEKKKTLPIITLFSKANNDDKLILANIYKSSKIVGQDIQTILGLLDKYKVKQSVLNKYHTYKQLTLESIKDLDLGNNRASYLEIIDWLLPEIN